MSLPVDQGLLQSNSCSFTGFFKVFLKSIFSSHEDLKYCLYKSPGSGIYGISFCTMNLEIKEAKKHFSTALKHYFKISLVF